MITTHKDRIFFIILSTLSFIALVYGFTQIGSPFEQQKMKWDHQRVVDLAMLKEAIDGEYDNNNYLLPKTIELIKKEYVSESGLKKVDPQTNQPYTYTVTSPATYKLCATFETDNKNLSSEKDYDGELYSYQRYRETFKHPKGYHCFDFEVKDYHPLRLFKFTKPQAEETLCYGSDYTITWETSNAVKEIRLFIKPKDTDTTLSAVDLDPKIFLPAGQKSFTWKVGNVKATNEIYNNQRFSFGAEIKTNPKRYTEDYFGDTFTIADCVNDKPYAVIGDALSYPASPTPIVVFND